MSEKPNFEAKEMNEEELSDAELNDVSGGSCGCGGTCSPARCSGGCDSSGGGLSQ